MSVGGGGERGGGGGRQRVPTMAGHRLILSLLNLSHTRSKAYPQESTTFTTQVISQSRSE